MRTVDVTWDQVAGQFQASGTARGHQVTINAPGMPGQPNMALASMGIYVFDSEVLINALKADAANPDSHHDFGKNIIPALIGQGRTYAYPFYDENKKTAKYWRDIGTLDAFYDANMDLCGVDPEFNLYDPEWPLRTYQLQAPPANVPHRTTSTNV